MSRLIEQRPVPPQYQQPGRFSEDWLLAADTVEIVDYLPGTHLRIWYNNDKGIYDFHHHSAMEFILCVENQSTVIANGQTFHLQAGDILIIPSRMLHKLIFETFGVRFIGLIDTDILKCYHDFKTLDPVFMNPFHCTPFTHPTIYQDIYDLITQMVNTYFENNAFAEIQIYGIFLKLSSVIGSYHFSKTISSDSNSLNVKQMEYFEKFSGLLSYIDANCTQELTLELVAQQMGFSKFHFSRLFKLYTGTTFYNYLCRKRIQVAQALLSTDVSITNAAFQSGFNNLTTFCRCFKKFTDFSPSEYRTRLFEDK